MQFIERIKRENLHGFDLLFNEYLIKYQDYLVPLFWNRLLEYCRPVFPKYVDKVYHNTCTVVGGASGLNNYRG